MSAIEPQGDEQTRSDPVPEALDRPDETIDGGRPTETDFHEILSNPRRRYAINYLKFREEAVELGTLAEHLAAWEQDIQLRDVSSAQRKRTYTALQQEHLPKMDSVDIVDFDRRDGVVKPAASLGDIDIYTEVVSGWNFPWSDYYLGLSGRGVLLLLGSAIDVSPLATLPDLAAGVFVVTAFGVSALAHAIITRRMKLGRQPDPPEPEG
jgi:hypothetical protein